MTITADPPVTADTPVRVSPTSSTTAMELRTLDQKIEYAQQLSFAEVLPREYRGKAPSILFAIEFGAMLGLHPIAAINNIHIIEGKPSAAASLLQAMARNAGHKVRIWDTMGDDGFPVGHCEIVRADDPDFTFKATFTIEDAERANRLTIRNGKIDSKGRSGNPTSWETYPRAMVKHRALSECVRDACQEALLGVMYTPEELGAEVDGEGKFLTYPAGSEEAARVMRGEAYDTAQAATGDIIPGHVVEDEEPPDPATLHTWLVDEIAEIAEILGQTFEEPAKVLLLRAFEGELPAGGLESRAAVNRQLDEADPAALMRVLAPLRGHIASTLTQRNGDGDRDAAVAYLRAGTRFAPVRELFGRPPQSTVTRAAGTAPAEPAGDGPAEEPAATEPLEAHPFVSGRDTADTCNECPHPAHHPVHDPLHGV